MEEQNVSRRKFLKGGAVLGAAVGLSTLAGGKVTEEAAKAMGKKELDSFPYEVKDDIKPFDEANVTFYRHSFQEETILEMVEGLPGLYQVVDNSRPGMTQLDIAFMQGAYTMLNFFDSKVYHWNYKPTREMYKFASKEDASKSIKKAAKFYGASLVGITPYDERWVYDPQVKLVPKDVKSSAKFLSTFTKMSRDDIPFKPKSVIVMAIEMDYETFALAPSLLGDAAAGLGYSNMLELSLKVTNFLNELGYNAFPAGNDSAESVPYAIAAGLGEQGRNGLLITYEYGPRVRLCKVFTDMELAYDKPIEFGANKFCKVCKKCATNCPSESISTADDMTWEPEKPSLSNHPGVLKYYVHYDTCYKYWTSSGTGCGVCVAVCPYNKPSFWHHRITTALTATPLKPFLNEMDDLFGYGNIYADQEMIDYWDVENYLR